MTHITIIGCGLIGGSFAALAKDAGQTVHGIDSNESSLVYAHSTGIIDTFSTEINASVIRTTDVIIIATPTASIIGILQSLTTKIAHPCKIIEFSSVKSWVSHPIVSESHHEITSAHPMGGSDEQGIHHASANILRNRPMIVFNSNQQTNAWFKSLSFKLVHCESFEQHDQWMSHVSHGPYLLSVLLPLLISKRDCTYIQHLASIAAGGFKDTTRVSNSPIEWGASILLENQSAMLPLIDELVETLTTVKTMIQSKQTLALTNDLLTAKKTRQQVVDDTH